MADFDPRNLLPGGRPPLAPLPPRGADSSLPSGGPPDGDFERPYVSAHGVVALWLGIASAGIILLPDGGGWYLAPFLGAAAWYLGHQGMGRIYRGESDFRETWSAKRGRLVGAIMTILGSIYLLLHVFIVGVRTFVPFGAPPTPVAAPMTPPPGFDQYGRPILPPGAVVTHQWSHKGPPNHGHVPNH